MAKMTHCECKYCWDTQWMLQWNVREDDEEGAPCYSHYLMIFIELQDENRKPVQFDSVKFKLETTRIPLTLRDRLRLVFSNRGNLEINLVESLINQAVTSAKLKYAGYEYSVVNKREACGPGQ